MSAPRNRRGEIVLPARIESPPLDLTGKRFGRLVVQSRKETGSANRWVCVCDCGATTVVYRYNLTSGNTNSCGCLKREKSAAIVASRPVWRGGNKRGTA